MHLLKNVNKKRFYRRRVTRGMNHLCGTFLFFFSTSTKKKGEKLEIEYIDNLHSNKSANISHHILFRFICLSIMEIYMRYT